MIKLHISVNSNDLMSNHGGMRELATAEGKAISAEGRHDVAGPHSVGSRLCFVSVDHLILAPVH